MEVEIKKGNCDCEIVEVAFSSLIIFLGPVYCVWWEAGKVCYFSEWWWNRAIDTGERLLQKISGRFTKVPWRESEIKKSCCQEGSSSKKINVVSNSTMIIKVLLNINYWTVDKSLDILRYISQRIWIKTWIKCKLMLQWLTKILSLNIIKFIFQIRLASWSLPIKVIFSSRVDLRAQ